MARIYIRKYVSLEDYFDKYGFDDGEEDQGWFYQSSAIKIINKNFKGTGITAGTYDACSSHNNCQIALYRNNKEMDFEGKAIFDTAAWEEYLKQPYAKKFANIMKKCNAEFEADVLDDITKIINTPDKDLPLLVGVLKDKNAIKLFNRLLKK